MDKIKIINGSYKIRGKDVDLAGMVFPLVEGFKWGTKGSYVTVDGAAVAGFPDRNIKICLLYTSPSPRDLSTSRMPSSA